MNVNTRWVAAGLICFTFSQTASAGPNGSPSASGSETSAKADDSKVCFNEGLLNEGSVIQYTTLMSGDFVYSPSRVGLLVKGPKKFNGVKSIETLHETYNKDGSVAYANSSFSELKNGNLVIYGGKSADRKFINSPPARYPIAMKIGDSIRLKYNTIRYDEDGNEQTETQREVYTFVGFDTMTVRLGKFKFCKFTSRSTPTDGLYSVINRVTWIPAEGPYRGFALRTKTSGKGKGVPSFVQFWEVTKIQKFDLR